MFADACWALTAGEVSPAMLKSIKSTVRYRCLAGCFLTDHPIVSPNCVVFLNQHNWQVCYKLKAPGDDAAGSRLITRVDLSHPPPTTTSPLTLRAPGKERFMVPNSEPWTF